MKPRRWTPEHGKPLVCVYWNDADVSAPTDAFYEEELQHSDTLVETYGLLVKQDEHAIIVVTETYTEDNGKRIFRDKTSIPSSLVRRVEVIAEPWKPKPRKKRAHRIEQPASPAPVKPPLGAT